MNTIIGIINPLRLLFAALAVFAALTGCKHGAAKDDDDDDVATPAGKSQAKIEAKIAHPRIGGIAESQPLNATTEYLLNDIARAPIAGYLLKINAAPGQQVKKGDILFTMQSKEAAAIPADTLIPDRGTVSVKAAETGVVRSVERQPGDYMQEGDPLCTLAVSSSLAFILDVPFESRRFLLPGKEYNIVLPDGSTGKAVISSQIPAMDRSVQMERFLLKTSSFGNLPEGLIATVRIPTRSESGTVILPRSALLSDESQSRFWIMKMVNDTLAIKNNIVKGLETADSVEIKSPALSPNDRILISDNYGVPDTVPVKIVQ